MNFPNKNDAGFVSFYFREGRQHLMCEVNLEGKRTVDKLKEWLLKEKQVVVKDLLIFCGDLVGTMVTDEILDTVRGGNVLCVRVFEADS